jgi:hypothetical protein
MAMGFPEDDLSADDIAGKFQSSRGVCPSYDAGLKLMVVEYAESTDNCQAAKHFGELEKNVRDWHNVKLQLQNAQAMGWASEAPRTEGLLWWTNVLRGMSDTCRPKGTLSPGRQCS